MTSDNELSRALMNPTFIGAVFGFACGCIFNHYQKVPSPKELAPLMLPQIEQADALLFFATNNLGKHSSATSLTLPDSIRSTYEGCKNEATKTFQVNNNVAVMEDQIIASATILDRTEMVACFQREAQDLKDQQKFIKRRAGQPLIIGTAGGLFLGLCAHGLLLFRQKRRSNQQASAHPT